MPTALSDCDWERRHCHWSGHCLGMPCTGFNDCSNQWICVQGICALKCSNATSAVLPPWVTPASTFATRPNSASATLTDTAGQSSTGTGAPTAATSSSSDDDSGGISTGGAIGVGVAIPLVVIAIAVAGFLYWRKHRKVVQLQLELQNRDEPPAAKTMPSDSMPPGSMPLSDTKPPSVGSHAGSAGPLINEAGGTSVSEMAAVNRNRQSLNPAELPANEMAPPPAYGHGDIKMDAISYEQARPGHVHEAPGTIPSPQSAHLSPDSDAGSRTEPLGRPPISPMGSDTMAVPGTVDVVSPATPRQQGR